MTDKELRRLGRQELLELLLEQREENEALRQQVQDMEIQLADRQIHLTEAGTMAEAALKLNGVFEAADRAVRQYLQSVRRAQEEGTLRHG